MFRYIDAAGISAYVAALFITVYTDTVTVYYVLEHGADDEGYQYLMVVLVTMRIFFQFWPESG